MEEEDDDNESFESARNEMDDDVGIVVQPQQQEEEKEDMGENNERQQQQQQQQQESLMVVLNPEQHDSNDDNNNNNLQDEGIVVGYEGDDNGNVDGNVNESKNDDDGGGNDLLLDMTTTTTSPRNNDTSNNNNEEMNVIPSSNSMDLNNVKKDEETHTPSNSDNDDDDDDKASMTHHDHHNSMSSSGIRTPAPNSGGGGGGGGGDFFADVTLDMEEALGIAETPESSCMKRKPLVMGDGLREGVVGGGGLPPPPALMGGSSSGSVMMMMMTESKDVGVGGGGVSEGGGEGDVENKEDDGKRNVEEEEENVVMETVDLTVTGTEVTPPTPVDLLNNDIPPPSSDLGNVEMTNTSNKLEPQQPQQESTTSSSSENTLITSNNNNTNNNFNQPQSLASLPSNRPTYRPRPPRRPRDASWAAAAITLIPMMLLLPFYYSHNNHHHHHKKHTSSWIEASMSTPAHTITFFICIFSTTSTLILSRMFYRSMGGGDGEDARFVASNLILNCGGVSRGGCIGLLILLLWRVPGGFWPFGLLLFGILIWDGLVFRRRRRNGKVCCGILVDGGGRGGGRDVVQTAGDLTSSSSSSASTRNRRNRHGTGSNGSQNTTTTEDGKRLFFRALLCTALDILSRSLRRQSFYRVVSSIMLFQFLVVIFWKSALFHALSVSDTWFGKLVVMGVLVGGKWATGTVGRVLGLISSGGITSWFAQQSILIEEMERMKANKRREEEVMEEERRKVMAGTLGKEQLGSDDKTGKKGYNNNNKNNKNNDEDDISGRAAARAALHSIPEAYRTAAASAYSPMIDFDDGMDDDYDSDPEDNNTTTATPTEDGIFINPSGKGIGGGGNRQSRLHTSDWTGTGDGSHHGGSGGGSTVKAFLFSAMTVSFGSVAQCALLGGLAQFVWSVVRNTDEVWSVLSRRFGGSTGFREMDIGDDGVEVGASTMSWQQVLVMLYKRLDRVARGFVRSHSDLAMSHVAAYYKSYQRAANDVALLIDQSGVEPIVHDDITTNMCSLVSSAISSILVFIFGFLLSIHRSSSADSNNIRLSDRSICEVMFVSYILSYTIVFTVMEPIRASIKAIYVCFAQHPQSLSQAFPLIFHRLNRISSNSQSASAAASSSSTLV